MRYYTLITLAALIVSSALAGSTADIISESGVTGGFVVIVGCDDADQLPKLSQGYMIQYLDTDSTKVDKMRARIMSKGVYGQVSASTFDGKTLPYVNNLVNLLVFDKSAAGSLQLAAKEIERALAPRGALISNFQVPSSNFQVDRKGKWFVYTKPVPDSIDDWSHFLYDSSNNGISRDTVVGPPRHLQWVAAPAFTRDHGRDKGISPAVRTVLSASGRVYYIIDETRSSNLSLSSKWTLIARDAFSGVELWRKSIEATKYPGKLELLWRSLIADDEKGGRIYSYMKYGGPLSQIDGATGEELLQYAGTEGSGEVIKDGSRLFFVKDGTIIAYDSEKAEKLWSWTPDDGDKIFPLTMAAANGKVFVKTEKSAVSLAAKSGKLLWQTKLQELKSKKGLREPQEKMLVSDGIVLCSYAGDDPKVLYQDNQEYTGLHAKVELYNGKMAALTADKGEILWTAPYLPSIENGMPGEIYVQDGKILLGPDFSMTRDLKTGKVQKGKDVISGLWTQGHHYRCYPGKATANYVITAKRGVEMINIGGDNHSRNNWLRGTCKIGVTPANGLLYCPPHSCSCYMEAKLFGFYALAPEREGESHTEAQRAQRDKERLTKGKAYGKAKASASESEWDTFLSGNERRGSTTTKLSSDSKKSWNTSLGGKLSAATIADGKAFIAQIDAHTVHALDLKSGKKVWKFTAGARVDSPPTYHDGQVLFGSSDGYVYCLRSSDGELAWKFLAAQKDLSATVYGQLESVWPVHGSVLVEGDVAYAAAGRSSYVDDGIMMYGLDVKTGKVLSNRLLKDEHVGYSEPPADAAEQLKRMGQQWLDYKTTMEPDKSDSFAMHGVLSDIISFVDGSLFMRQMRFDKELKVVEGPRQHIYSTSDMLDGQEFNRNYWLLGTADFTRTPVASPWLFKRTFGDAHVGVPYGLMLCHDDKMVWGVHRAGKGGYDIFSKSRPDPDAKESLLPDLVKRSSANTEDKGWKAKLSFRPRSIILCGDTLVTGGIAEDNTGMLRLTAAASGETVKEIAVSASPVWAGMAAAESRLIVPMEDGSVTCITK